VAGRLKKPTGASANKLPRDMGVGGADADETNCRPASGGRSHGRPATGAPRKPVGLTARILHPKRFCVLDDGPGRWEAAAGHSQSLSRPSTSRRIKIDASLPDSILPICSGGIDIIILALR
jgi:hypothetical protein